MMKNIYNKVHVENQIKENNCVIHFPRTNPDKPIDVGTFSNNLKVAINDTNDTSSNSIVYKSPIPLDIRIHATLENISSISDIVIKVLNTLLYSLI
jgi:hypothetical protein